MPFSLFFFHYLRNNADEDKSPIFLSDKNYQTLSKKFKQKKMLKKKNEENAKQNRGILELFYWIKHCQTFINFDNYYFSF